MDYQIWLGPAALYGVHSLSESVAREVSVYDAVGSKKFSQAEQRGLKSWEIQCELTERNDRGLPNWEAASDLLEGLEPLFEKKTPTRLVIRDGRGRISERVLIKNLSKDETAKGVYDVKLSCTEYVEEGKKSSVGAPIPTRPGRPPEMPETVTVRRETDLLDLQKKAEQSGTVVSLRRIEDNRPVKNPVTLEPGSTLRVAIESDSNSAFLTEQQREEIWLNKSQEALGQALGEAEDSLPGYGSE